MYLSRLTLNMRSRAVRRDMADCQQLHRTVMAAFPECTEEARVHYNVLHRLESEPRTGRMQLYVQSAVQPDWSRLPASYLASEQSQPEVKSVAESYAAIRDGMVLAFRLRANPTRKVDTKSGPNGEKRNGRRVKLTTEEEQVNWLMRKAADGGFALLDVRCTSELAELARTQAVGEQTGQHPAGRMTFGSVLFEGYLRVTDAERFRVILQTGIGSAKAYGFGLFSVARA